MSDLDLQWFRRSWFVEVKFLISRSFLSSSFSRSFAFVWFRTSEVSRTFSSGPQHHWAQTRWLRSSSIRSVAKFPELSPSCDISVQVQSEHSSVWNTLKARCDCTSSVIRSVNVVKCPDCSFHGCCSSERQPSFGHTFASVRHLIQQILSSNHVSNVWTCLSLEVRWFAPSPTLSVNVNVSGTTFTSDVRGRTNQHVVRLHEAQRCIKTDIYSSARSCLNQPRTWPCTNVRSIETHTCIRWSPQCRVGDVPKRLCIGICQGSKLVSF